MIGQYLSNKNESVTVSKSKKFLYLNKASVTDTVMVISGLNSPFFLLIVINIGAGIGGNTCCPPLKFFMIISDSVSGNSESRVGNQNYKEKT